ncbi:hypothetical protein [uncultured Cetobacterium sp.]|uniref:hypothetical protein n=1 Tax=uncultured Cetobacterium sp. TaxID=527638 RepID=UPI00262C3F45|nr:hypothetical protein [uncultured Cetobacterium sp.]
MKYIFLFFMCTLNIFSSLETEVPKLPVDDLLERNELGEIIGRRILEKNTTVYLESKVKIVVPLEIISDIDIEALVIDNEKLEIPFEIELNKTPKRKDYYKLKYSEDKIDIDLDGEVDTYIYSSKFINTNILRDNILYIDGEKISKEGTFKRKIYMTIEVRE